MIIRHAVPPDATAIAKVHVDAWRSTYQGIVSQAYLDQLSYNERQQLWDNVLATTNPRHIVLVVVNEDTTIVGFAAAGPAREDIAGYSAELYAIYMLPSYQGKGLGRQLMQRLNAWLTEMCSDGMYLWVLEQNSSQQFYEKLGWQQLGLKKEVILGDQALVEVAYGFKYVGT